MKTRDFLQELESKSVDELKARKIDLLKEQFNLRMQRGTGQVTQNHIFKKIRRDIARINTVMLKKQKMK